MMSHLQLNYSSNQMLLLKTNKWRTKMGWAPMAQYSNQVLWRLVN